MIDFVMGIDPGLRGAGVVLRSDGSYVSSFQLPARADELRDRLDGWHGRVHVFVERAQAFPGAGVASSFNYGTGYGRILGVLEMLAMPFTPVNPSFWSKMMTKGAPGPNAKARAKHVCMRLFPMLAVKHDGFRDAALIAEFGRRQLFGGW